MILADFKQVQERSDNIRHKNRRNEEQNSQMIGSRYSNIISGINNNKKRIQRSVNDYIEQLGIGNLNQLYEKQNREKNKNINKTIKQQQQLKLKQSVQRLYSTGFNKSKLNTTNNKNSQTKQHQIIMKNSKNKQEIYNNQYNNQSQEGQNNNQQKYQQDKQVHYYNQLYQQEEGFDEKFKIRKVQLQCVKLVNKLLNKFTIKYELWLVQNNKQLVQKQYYQKTLKSSNPKSKYQIILKSQAIKYFIKSLLQFILSITKLSNFNSYIQQLSQSEQFFIKYSDYINKYKLKTWKITYKTKNNISNQNKDKSKQKRNNKQKQQSNQQQQQFNQNLYYQLKQFAYSFPFIYFLLNFQCLQKIEQVNFNYINDLYNWIQINVDKSRNWQFIYNKFQSSLNPKFTVPYQTKLYQIKNHKPQLQNNQDDQQQHKFKQIKPNPIPSSTYNKPKQRPKSQKKSTKPMPFNFTQTHSNIPKITQQQLYSWNRNFKAKPIPKTVYKPQILTLPQKQKEQNKKKHKQQLYHQSKYPKTMNYLQNYNQYKQQKIKQISQKYQKDNKIVKSKPIPNFELIHKKQTQLLQTRKQQNRSNTQLKPFKFSQTKKPDLKSLLKTTLIVDQQLQQTQSKKKKDIIYNTQMPEARSTVKFDAYINMRKQQKQQKKNQIKQRQQMKKRKQQDMKVYKDILKQRMHNQLVNQPKPIQYNYGKGSQNVVRVNMEEIYLQRPLLMTSTQKNGKGKQKMADDKKTTFTDAFQPII